MYQYFFFVVVPVVAVVALLMSLPVKRRWNKISTFVESKAEVSKKDTPFSFAKRVAWSVGTARR